MHGTIVVLGIEVRVALTLDERAIEFAIDIR